MADPRFKVKRQAYFQRGITAASKITASVGIDTTTGSVSTFAGGLTATSVVSLTGGLTAASTVLVTGSLVSGTGGTAIAGILCGSALVKLDDNIASSAASATCFDIVGLTTAHKIFISTACADGELSAASIFSNPASPINCMITYVNLIGDEVDCNGASEVYYIAVLDK